MFTDLVTAEKANDMMTTRQVAEVLGCSVKTVLNNVGKYLPNKKIENGKMATFSKAEVTVLLEGMKGNTTNQFNLESRLQGVTTDMTPALMLKQAMELADRAYKMELENLKAKNIEVVEENGKLRLEVKQLSHALEYDKVKGWLRWSDVKKELDLHYNFTWFVSEYGFIEHEDFERKIMGYDNYPTILINPESIRFLLEDK